MWRVRSTTFMFLIGLATFLAACGDHPAAAVIPPAPTLPVLSQPAMLAPDQVFVTELLTGDVAQLGWQTTHVTKSVHGLGLSPDGHTLYVSDIADTAVVAFPSCRAHVSARRAGSVCVGRPCIWCRRWMAARSMCRTSAKHPSLSWMWRAGR